MRRLSPSSSTPIRAAWPRAGTLAEAWDLAFRCDPVSPFGGIVAVNRTLDDGGSREDRGHPDRGDRRAGRRRSGESGRWRGKKNLRLLLTGGLPDPAAPGLTFRSLAGGFLAQTRDAGRIGRDGSARGDAARAD